MSVWHEARREESRRAERCRAFVLFTDTGKTFNVSLTGG